MELYDQAPNRECVTINDLQALTGGVAKGKNDFVGTVAHEIGHALGFTSGVEYLVNVGPTRFGQFYSEEYLTFVHLLDLFRFSKESYNEGQKLKTPVIDFTADNRVKYLSLDGGKTPYKAADGAIAYFARGVHKPVGEKSFGDGFGSGHWFSGIAVGNKVKESTLPKPPIGVMQGLLLRGQRVPDISEADLAAFTVMGWDVKKK